MNLLIYYSRYIKERRKKLEYFEHNNHDSLTRIPKYNEYAENDLRKKFIDEYKKIVKRKLKVRIFNISFYSWPPENILAVHIYLEKLEGDQYVSTPITHTPQAFTPIMEDSFLGTKSGQMILYSGTFSNTTDVSKEMVEHFRLRMWVAQDVIIDSTSKSFQVKLNVTAKAV